MAELGVVMALIDDAGSPDPEVIEQAVSDWLEEHPEATTTVEDGSITYAKLAEAVQEKLDEIDSLTEAIENIEDVLTTDGEASSEVETDITNTYTSGKRILLNVGVGNTVDMTPGNSSTFGYIVSETLSVIE